MDAVDVILIVIGSLFALVVLLFVAGRISSRRKKNATQELAKKIKKLDKTDVKKQGEKPKQEFDLQPPVQKQFEEKIAKNVNPIVTSYEDFDEDEKDLLGTKASIEKEEPRKRRSFEEIMRNRRQAGNSSAGTPTEIPEEDQEFDEFRKQHSSYISYKADQALIEEIKGLSPEMKSIIFNNLFNRVDHDKF